MFKKSSAHFWCLLLGLALSPVAGIAQTTFLNFDAPGQFTGNFSLWEDVGGVNGNNYSFEENSADGVGGGGGISVYQNNDTTASYNAGSWNISADGAAIIESMLVYTDGQSNGDKVQFGVANSTTNGLNNNAGVVFESFRFIPNSATSWGLYEQFRTNNNMVTGASLGSVTVATGHWYKFVVGITNTSASTGILSAGCALYDYGTDGLTPGANLITFSAAVSHAAGDVLTSAALWPAFRAFEDAGISAVDNFLVYTPASLPVITFPLTNSTATLGSSANFAALADGPGLITYAWYTNGVQVAGLSDSTYSISSIPSSLANVAVVAANANGSVTNQATITVSSQTLPQVANAAATAIGATVATLNGQVISTGGAPTTVVFYYGETDGGTNAGAWTDHVSLGVQGGTFAETVQSLSTNTTYYFTCSAVNGVGTTWAAPSSQFTTLASNIVSTAAAVLTYQYDNTRAGVNSNETSLTPQNVKTSSFGRLFTDSVDGLVYAQPLIVPNVISPGAGTHNVLYVATEHDSVYAFDADDNTGSNAAPLWHTSFLGLGVTTVPSGNVDTADITPEIGITSTPVIDPISGTLYVEVKTLEPGTTYVHRLHALDITTGLERSNFNSPVVISCNNYPGSGTGDNDGESPPHVLWNPLREHCRPAMTLLNGVVYMSFASHGDNGPYHGWFFGYNATNFSIAPSVYNSTPNGGLGGFWDGGGGPSVDSQGNLYFQTGNGDFNGTSAISPAANYAMSLIK
ncbi:MAG TPA: immunoglobulin domain-containing protein, partial [Verrucomicrobiae bacterium]|nr:immunoglobulin domain-containing protein [Verrucomicrobiae bacterium]